MRIRSPEFQAMSERVLAATTLTSRLNVLPFDDEAGKAELMEQILGFITMGHPVDIDARREWLTGGPIDVSENV